MDGQSFHGPPEVGLPNVESEFHAPETRSNRPGKSQGCEGSRRAWDRLVDLAPSTGNARHSGRARGERSKVAVQERGRLRENGRRAAASDVQRRDAVGIAQPSARQAVGVDHDHACRQWIPLRIDAIVVLVDDHDIDNPAERRTGQGQRDLRSGVRLLVRDSWWNLDDQSRQERCGELSHRGRRRRLALKQQFPLQLRPRTHQRHVAGRIHGAQPVVELEADARVANDGAVEVEFHRLWSFAAGRLVERQGAGPRAFRAVFQKSCFDIRGSVQLAAQDERLKAGRHGEHDASLADLSCHAEPLVADTRHRQRNRPQTILTTMHQSIGGSWHPRICRRRRRGFRFGRNRLPADDGPDGQARDHPDAAFPPTRSLPAQGADDARHRLSTESGNT